MCRAVAAGGAAARPDDVNLEQQQQQQQQEPETAAEPSEGNLENTVVNSEAEAAESEAGEQDAEMPVDED